MRFVVRAVVSGAAIGVATWLLSGMEVVGADTWLGKALVLVLVGALFGVVNALVKPVVAVLSLPLYVLTLGLFHLVVNALMLMLTAWLTSFFDAGLRVDGFVTALFGALVVAVVSWVLSAFVDRD